ncbi:hypothetical protein BDV06DRAFT_134476 [Aspergillus oleicola]
MALVSGTSSVTFRGSNPRLVSFLFFFLFRFPFFLSFFRLSVPSYSPRRRS